MGRYKILSALEKAIGVVIDPESGNPTNTNCFSIHYGNKGTHIVPRKRRIKKWTYNNTRVKK